MEKRQLKSFIRTKINFGDYVLFQKYTRLFQRKNMETNTNIDFYGISKPIFAIYLGCFVADQTLGFNYVEWINEKRDKMAEIKCFIEWDDYSDVLGVWKNKPTMQEMLKAYRNYNKNKVANSNEINFEY